MTIYVPVPIEERLPDDRKKVLVILPGGRQTFAFFDRETKYWVEFGAIVIIDTPVTWYDSVDLPAHHELELGQRNAWEDFNKETLDTEGAHYGGWMAGVNYLLNIINGKK